eukprot:4441954-Pyramimonas_sp.AAC.1
MSPPHSRLPIPAVVVAGFAMVAASRGEPFVSLGALPAFHLYLRPTELKQMRWRHWSQPVGVALGGAAGRRRALRPNEDGGGLEGGGVRREHLHRRDGPPRVPQQGHGALPPR